MDGSSNLVEEVHTAQHMQEAAVGIRAIIVRLMDQWWGQIISQIGNIANWPFQRKFYKIYKLAVTYHISWVFNMTKIAIDFGHFLLLKHEANKQMNRKNSFKFESKWTTVWHK